MIPAILWFWLLMIFIVQSSLICCFIKLEIIIRKNLMAPKIWLCIQMNGKITRDWKQKNLQDISLQVFCFAHYREICKCARRETTYISIQRSKVEDKTNWNTFNYWLLNFLVLTLPPLLSISVHHIDTAWALSNLSYLKEKHILMNRILLCCNILMMAR